MSDKVKPYRLVEYDQFDAIKSSREFDSQATAASYWMLSVARGNRAELLCNFDTGEGPHGDGTLRDQSGRAV